MIVANAGSGFFAVALLVAVVAPQAQATAGATVAATPAATAPATAIPPTTAPLPTPSPAYGFVYKTTPSPESTPFPGPNPPAISEIDLSDSTLVTPGIVRVRVLTNEAVVSVAAETFGSSIPIVRAAPGIFTLEGYVPAVPSSYKNHSYDVTFTASSADGRQVHVILPLTLK